jgi:hypothetical protein
MHCNVRFLEGREAKTWPLYSQFYEAEFLNVGGNLFPYEDIDRAIELGEKYKKLPIYLYIYISFISD